MQSTSMTDQTINLRHSPLANNPDGTADCMERIKVFDTGALFAGQNEVFIRHGSETYRLRLTRQNRLILTK